MWTGKEWESVRLDTKGGEREDAVEAKGVGYDTCDVAEVIPELCGGVVSAV